MNKIVTSTLKLLLPDNFYMPLRAAYLKLKKTPPYVKGVYDFDLYQNINDLDYSRHKGEKLDSISKSKDGSVLKVAQFFLKTGDTAIDIGANIGLMSLGMSRFVGPKGNVVSIEPGPISFALLRANKFINYKIAKNLILIDAACTDVNKEVPLFVNPRGESDNQVHKNLKKYKFRREPHRDVYMVNGITLDTLISNLKTSNNISFIKIDTQGHELYVLKGGQRFFRKKRDLAILCEFAPYLKAWEKIDVNQFYKLIKSFGFSLFDISNLEYGEINFTYLQNNYGFKKIGKYTDLLLLKGNALKKFQINSAKI